MTRHLTILNNDLQPTHADAFFKQEEDQDRRIGLPSSIRNKISSMDELTSIRNKLSSLEQMEHRNPLTSTITQRVARSSYLPQQSFTTKNSDTTDDPNAFIRAVRIPSSQPSGDATTPGAINLHASTASLYASAASTFSSTNSNLASLRHAVQALRNTPFAHATGISMDDHANHQDDTHLDTISTISHHEYPEQRRPPSTRQQTPGPPLTNTRAETHSYSQHDIQSIPKVCSTSISASPAITEYDGDDVIMGGVTPSISTVHATASTALRSSRFRTEALRQGITPLASRSAFRKALQADAPPKTTEKPSPTIIINKYTGKDTPAGDFDEKTPSPTVVLSHFQDLNHPHGGRMANNGAASAATVSHMYVPSTAAYTPEASAGSSVSNNPLFAGTPSNPTPGSVTMAVKSMTDGAEDGLKQQGEGTVHIGQFNAAVQGLKLAEKLQQAAEKLSTPLATVVTHGGTNVPASVASNGREREIKELSLDAVPSVQISSGFQFRDDVAALLRALDVGTPTVQPLTGGAAVRALADASTEERPKPRSRIRPSLSPSSVAMLDLSKFDANGERHAPASIIKESNRSNPRTVDMSASSGNDSETTRALTQRVAELEAQREEAASLLSGYQGSIAELQDRHSSNIVRLQAEAALAKSECERLRAERGEIQEEFETLYKDKYLPLKSEAVALRKGGAALRAELAERERAMKKAAELEQEIVAARKVIDAAQKAGEVAKAEAIAAREAERLAEKRAADAAALLEGTERKWAAKYEAEGKRAEKVLHAKAVEVKGLKEKLEALSRSHDDAVHRYHVEQAKKERKEKEISLREDEICDLQLKLKEMERVLGEYRAENEKFYGVKEKYKAAVAALEAELVKKERENASLANMCNELLTDLEQKQQRQGGGK